MGLRLGGGARRYVTFYPQDTGDISGSVCRWRRVSARANGQLDTFICSLWSWRGGLTEGSRTTAAGVRQLNGNVHVCERERERRKEKRKKKQGRDEIKEKHDNTSEKGRDRCLRRGRSLNIYLCLPTLRGEMAVWFHYTSITAVVNGCVTVY